MIFPNKPIFYSVKESKNNYHLKNLVIKIEEIQIFLKLKQN